LDESVDLLGENLHGAAVEVEDIEALLNALAGYGRAGREAQTHEGLIRLNVVSHKTVFCGNLEDLVDLEETQTLDVDGATLLVRAVVVVRVDSLNLIVLLEVEDLQRHTFNMIRKFSFVGSSDADTERITE
jgi:hypothetical protein